MTTTAATDQGPGRGVQVLGALLQPRLPEPGGDRTRPTSWCCASRVRRSVSHVRGSGALGILASRDGDGGPHASAPVLVSDG